MNLQLINIGFGNLVAAYRLIAIVSPESAPVKRIIQEARESGGLIDATCSPAGVYVVFANLASKKKNLDVFPAGNHAGASAVRGYRRAAEVASTGK